MSKEKDVTILAVPSKNEAQVSANTVDGMQILNNVTGTSLEHSVTGDKINLILNAIRNKGLTFTFKLAE